MKRSRIITILSLTVFCCLILSNIISLISMRKISQEHTTAFLKTMSSDIYHSVCDELTETLNVAKTVANDSLLMDILEDDGELDSDDIAQKLATYTGRIKDTFSYSWVFVVSDKSKEYYSDIGLYRVIDPDNEPDDEWYKEFVDSGKEYNLTIGQDNDNSDVWTVFIDVRINDENGKFLGVSGMALEIQNLQELIRDYEEEYEVEIRFLDDEGQPQIESGNIEDYASEIYKVPDSSEVGQITMSRNQIKPSYTITRYIDQLDWYMVVRDINPYPYTTDFMVILLNILIFAMLLVVSIISIRHIKIGAGTLFYESYIDNMTGLYNRRAYDDKLASLSQQDNLNNITVVVFDVNGLKKVNDTMGHAAGDELIKAAAKIINDSFGAYGKCYRTGGDEFVAILNKPIDDLGKITRNFELTQLEWKGENIKKLSISYGYVKGSDCDCSIDKMIYYADEHMYKKKKKYYNNTKNNRRKV